MIELNLKEEGNDTTNRLLLNKTAETILSDLGNEVEINSTKKALLDLMHGVAELSFSLNKLTDRDSILVDTYISADIKSGLYTVGQLYDMFNNIEHNGDNMFFRNNEPVNHIGRGELWRLVDNSISLVNYPTELAVEYDEHYLKFTYVRHRHK